MAQADWSFLTGGLTATDVDRGVTAGVSKPNGGGLNVYGFNSLAIVNGVVGKTNGQPSFAPMAKGGRITAAVKRGISGGPLGFAPFLFLGLQGTAVTDAGYLLGLSDGDPHHIVLRKGALTGGIPDTAVAPSAPNGILLRSTEAYPNDTWHHLRLDVIRQGTDDVVLQCYRSDLVSHPVGSPLWVVVPGMEGSQNPDIVGFVDDALGVNTGSPALTSGRAGIGFQVSQNARRAFFDHVVIARQI